MSEKKVLERDESYIYTYVSISSKNDKVVYCNLMSQLFPTKISVTANISDIINFQFHHIYVYSNRAMPRSVSSIL